MKYYTEVRKDYTERSGENVHTSDTSESLISKDALRLGGFAGNYHTERHGEKRNP